MFYESLTHAGYKWPTCTIIQHDMANKTPSVILRLHICLSFTIRFCIYIIYSYSIYSKSTVGSVFTIKRHKGASAARARGLLMVKTLNKCILISLVSNLIFRSINLYLLCLLIVKTLPNVLLTIT